ncbi:MAG: hypothetical protein ACR2FQ_02975 [Pseudonocardiaceae bacterium]
MALSKQAIEPYVSQLYTIREDAAYSAQSYFEAAKSAEFWGRAIVFVPALLGAIAGIIVALGGTREWGAVGAVVGAVAATASFLGSDRKSGSFKDSARQFTKLRHRAAMEIKLAARKATESELEGTLRSLRRDYDSVVNASDPVPNRAFTKAKRRINAGVLECDLDSTTS